MTNGDRLERYAAVVALLNRDHRAGGEPSFAHIDRVSRDLAAAKQMVHRVQIEHVARSTANDVLRGVHTRRLRWELVASLWAVIHFIATQGGHDPDTMTSWHELHEAFHQPSQDRTASPGRESDTVRQLTPEPIPSQTPRAPFLPPDGPERSARDWAAGIDYGVLPCGTDLLSPDSLNTELGALAFGGPVGGDPYDAAQRRLDHARRLGRDIWWNEYRRIVPEWFGPYLTLERELALIRTYAPRRIPGLLQTPEYASHVIAADLPGSTQAEMALRLELRKMRQQQLLHQDAPHYWAVIDLRALTQEDIPPAVLRPQLQHLITMAANPRITLQFIREADAERVVPAGPITLMRFPESGVGNIVYLEQDDYGLYLAKKENVDYFSLRYHNLVINALKPHDSVKLLLERLDQLQP